jgi:hypothetical protein
MAWWVWLIIVVLAINALAALSMNTYYFGDSYLEDDD